MLTSDSEDEYSLRPETPPCVRIQQGKKLNYYQSLNRQYHVIRVQNKKEKKKKYYHALKEDLENGFGDNMLRLCASYYSIPYNANSYGYISGSSNIIDDGNINYSTNAPYGYYYWIHKDYNTCPQRKIEADFLYNGYIGWSGNYESFVDYHDDEVFSGDSDYSDYSDIDSLSDGMLCSPNSSIENNESFDYHHYDPIDDKNESDETDYGYDSY